MKTKPVEEILIPPEKREEILNELRQVTFEICNLLNDPIVCKICDKKWIEVNDLSSGQYPANKIIKFKTSMLTSDLWDYSDVYIVAKGTITVEGVNDDKKEIKN